MQVFYNVCAMLKLVAIDFDGTISDSVGMVLETYREAVSPYAGHILSDEEISVGFGMTEAGMMQAIVPESWAEALDEFFGLFRKADLTPCEGIIELIRELREMGIILAVITGRGDEGVRIGLGRLDLLDSFDDILTGSDVKNNKDENLQRLMNKYSLDNDEIIYIGDAVSDVLACRKAEVRCLSAAWSHHVNKEMLYELNPGDVYESVADAREVIMGLIDPEQERRK